MKQKISRIIKQNIYFKDQSSLLLRKQVSCLVCKKKNCKDREHLYIVTHHTIFDMVNGKVVETLSRKGIEEVNKLK